MMRFHIRHLLAITAFVAIGCVALPNASSTWAAAVWGCAVLILSAAVLMAIHRQDDQRAYWIGFALLGWICFLLCHYSFAVVELQNLQSVDGDPTSRYYRSWGIGNLPTTHLSWMAYRWLIATKAISKRIDVMQFINVAHAFWTILLATAGGIFAYWLRRTQQASK
jgi:hypothetical protein